MFSLHSSIPAMLEAGEGLLPRQLTRLIILPLTCHAGPGGLPALIGAQIPVMPATKRVAFTHDLGASVLHVP